MLSKVHEFIEVALSLHFAASAICAMTPTKKDDEILAKVYKVLEIFALNIGKGSANYSSKGSNQKTTPPLFLISSLSA